MIGGLGRALDGLLGRGEAAVTVPALDGALRPNRMLDEASRLPLPDVDCLASVAGQLLASAGDGLFALEAGDWRPRRTLEAAITCLAPLAGGLAVALAGGEVQVEGGAFGGRRYRAAPDLRCVTALAASGKDLFLANGSARHAPDDWQLDLLERGASGSLWHLDLDSGALRQLAGGLAFPAGLALDGTALVYAEAWRHRLVRLEAAGGRPEVLHADLPGYPGRLSPAGDGRDGGAWAAVFAPRSQLVEFVLREPGYRRRMVAEVPRPYWVAPKLRAGRSFYEPLQGGGVKHLGLLKPWAPTLSAGLCLRLDARFQPRSSLHSRADGATHGVTSVVEHQGQLYAAARGDGVVACLPLDAPGVAS